MSSSGAGKPALNFKNCLADPPLPISMQDEAPKKQLIHEKAWDLLKDIEIKVPLLEAIEHIPRYANTLKELCADQAMGLLPPEQFEQNQNIPAAFQWCKVAEKCKDPGTCAISCIIGKVRVDHCMLDLGASINILPYALYLTLDVGPLEPSDFTILLADKSCKKPEGVVTNVLVHVGKLSFLADFYVMKMEDEGMIDTSPVLLGRPFMMTAKAKIDIYTGDLSLEVDGEVVQLNIYESMQSPPNPARVHVLDGIGEGAIGSAMLCVEDAMERLPQKNVARVPVIKKSGAADSRAAKPPDETNNSASISMPAKPAKKKKKCKYRKPMKRKEESHTNCWIPRRNQEDKGKVESFLIGSASWKNR